MRELWPFFKADVLELLAWIFLFAAIVLLDHSSSDRIDAQGLLAIGSLWLAVVTARASGRAECHAPDE